MLVASQLIKPLAAAWLFFHSHPVSEGLSVVFQINKQGGKAPQFLHLTALIRADIGLETRGEDVWHS